MREWKISVPVGGSSLLVIFAVLCLTVFSMLGLATVQADRRLANTSVNAVSAYYEADCQAEIILAQLRQGEMPGGVTREGDRYAYSCPISDTQVLEVEVEVQGTDYTVLRWQAVSAVEWHLDEEIEVWDGDIPDM